MLFPWWQLVTLLYSADSNAQHAGLAIDWSGVNWRSAFGAKGLGSPGTIVSGLEVNLQRPAE
jgi:hypothetical protein